MTDSASPPVSPSTLFTEQHREAIRTACEKLWNDEPPENPIHSPRRDSHPLRLVGDRALDALNAVEAMIVAYEKALSHAHQLRIAAEQEREQARELCTRRGDRILEMRTENETLLRERDAAEERASRAEQDSKRLDWLDEDGKWSHGGYDAHTVGDSWVKTSREWSAQNVREAIDAAMRAHSTPTPETPTFSDADLPRQHLNVRKGKDL